MTTLVCKLRKKAMLIEKKQPNKLAQLTKLLL